MPVSATSCDLHIKLELVRARSVEDPYAFQMGPQKYILRSGGDSLAESTLDWNAQLLAKLAALRNPGSDPALAQELGEMLREFLIPIGWQGYAGKLLASDRENKQSAVTIRSHASELYALPWELLTVGATGQRLAEIRGVLLRYQWPQTVTTPESGPRPEGSRILVAWSAAGGGVPAAEHVQAIDRACRTADLRVDELCEVLPNASARQLIERLESASRAGRPISVLHLLCHGRAVGSTYGLSLDTDDSIGSAQAVDAAWLRRVVRKYAATLRLLVLCACDSGNSGVHGNYLGSLAQEAHRAGLAAVVASRFPLSVRGSIDLTDAFYHALLAGPEAQGPVSLENALRATREKLAQDPELRDWYSLQLYAREEDGDDSRPIIFRPYRGLLPFAYEHRRFFHGRNGEIHEVVSRLQSLIKNQKPRFLIVAGASGTGKSSLVQAGVVPHWLQSQQPPWDVKIMRPGAEPIRTFNAMLPKSVNRQMSLLLIVDQFEEVFTHVTNTAIRQEFAQLLWRLASDPEKRTAVILTLRIDFFGPCGELEVDSSIGRRLDKIACENEYRVLVARMDREQLRQAITLPAEQVGLRLQEGLYRQMLEEVGSEPGGLPLLEYTMDLLWQQRVGNTLTQAAYAQLGGVEGALHRHADTLIQEMSEIEQREARRLLVQLVRIGDDRSPSTRWRRPVASLRPSTPERAAAFDRVLAEMVAERLLVCDEQGAAQMIEVTHEALIRKWTTLQQWIEQDRQKLSDLLQLEDWAKQREIYPSFHLSGDLLDYAEVVARNYPEELSKRALHLLTASREEERKQRGLKERTRQLSLEPSIEQGRLELLRGNPLHAMLWLHQAYEQGSESPILPYLLAEAVRPLDAVRARLLGHLAGVNTARFCPDGSSIVTASNDKTARIWDTSSGRLRQVLAGHQDCVVAAQYSPDGNHIVTASNDRTARIWDTSSGRLHQVLAGHQGCVMAAQYSPDGNHIVTASDDKTARIWDAYSGKLRHELAGHQGYVITTQYSPDGSHIVTASDDNTARIWDAHSGRLCQSLTGHQSVVLTAQFSPDGSRVVTASSDEKARIWDARSGGLLQELAGHNEEVASAQFSPDGNRIVTASNDGTARIWDAHSGNLLKSLVGHQAYVRTAQFSPDGRYIITGSYDCSAGIWDAYSGELLQELAGHQSSINTAQFSPDGSRIVTSSEDKTVRVWAAHSGKLLRVVNSHASDLRDAKYDPNGRRIVIASSESALIWDTHSGKLCQVLAGHQHIVHCAQFSPDGRRIVTSSEDTTARLWDANSGKCLHVLTGHQAAVLTAQFSPDGDCIVTAGNEKTARLWDAHNGKLLQPLSGHQGRVATAQYSPDGRRILTAGDDKTARIWDVRSSKCLHVLTGHQAAILTARFSPDGKHVVTAGEDQSARIWDADDARLLQTLAVSEDTVRSAQYSPDGRFIVTTGHSILIWDAHSGKLLYELAKHRSIIKIVQYSPDGCCLLVVRGDEETAQILDAHSGKLIHEIIRHPSKVCTAQYSPDGKHIITVGSDGTMRIWDTAPETRSPEQVAGLMHRYLSYRLEGNVIVTVRPEDG